MTEFYTPSASMHESASKVEAQWRIIEQLYPELSTVVKYNMDRSEYANAAAAAAQADATTALALIGASASEVKFTDDGGIAVKVKNRTGGASVKGQVVVPCRTEYELSGDALNQLSAWTFAGESMANTDAGYLYWSLSVPNTVTYYWGGVTDAPVVYHYEGVVDSPTTYYWEGVTDGPVVYYYDCTVDAAVVYYWQTWLDGANATVSLFSDAGMTVKISEGALAGDGGGAIVLAAVGGSGITGTVTVTAGIQADTGTLSILDDVITEGGDAYAQCSAWTVAGEPQTMTTINVRNAPSGTILCSGTVDHDTGGVGVVLAAVGGSGITGTVDAIAGIIAYSSHSSRTLSMLDDVVTEAGDALNQFANWTIAGEPQTMYTINVYSDAGKTTLVSTGAVDHDTGGLGVAIAQHAGSGISWTVDIAASAVDDTDGANTLQVLDGAVTEAGDAGGQFANWTNAGAPATMYTVTVYDSIAHTTTLCQGTVDHVAGGAGVVLAAVGGSGISGTVDVVAGAVDSIVDGNTLSILDDVITENGDAGAQFNNWTIVGEPQTMYTVTVYADDAGTIPLCRGTVDHSAGGVGVVLASVSPELVSGTVDVIASATDDPVAAANTLTITAGVLVEAGDAGGCMSNWAIVGSEQTFVEVFSDAAKLVKVCDGSIDNTTGGAITLTAFGGSGLSGTVTAIPAAVADAAANNIVAFGYGKAAALCPINGTGVLGVVYQGGVANGSDMWVTVAGKAYVLREPASAIATGAWVRTGSTTAAYCECEWDYDAAQAQQQIGYALERVAAAGATTVLVGLSRR